MWAYLSPVSSSHRAEEHSVRLFVHTHGDALMVVVVMVAVVMMIRVC